MRVITVKLDENLLELLDRYAVKNKLNRSEAIRMAIEKLVKEDSEGTENKRRSCKDE
jgi:metal-responsive CopG/Arc/MetJ family transcriptional regulator